MLLSPILHVDIFSLWGTCRTS